MRQKRENGTISLVNDSTAQHRVQDPWPVTLPREKTEAETLGAFFLVSHRLGIARLIRHLESEFAFSLVENIRPSTGVDNTIRGRRKADEI